MARVSAVQRGVITSLQTAATALSSSRADAAGPLSSLVIGTRSRTDAIYHIGHLLKS